MEINWTGLKEYLVARAKERSTWVGFIGLAAAAGFTIEPELVINIATTASALAGLILVAIKDKPKIEETIVENTIVVTNKKDADVLAKALAAPVISV